MLDGQSLLNKIEADSKKCRQTPLPFFEEFLTLIWMDNTAEEARLRWRETVADFPWIADNSLYAMKYVLDHPPENLIEILNTKGWVGLYHEDTDEPYSYDEHLDWLNNIFLEFQDIYLQAAK
jgi:hypothetical protein